MSMFLGPGLGLLDFDSGVSGLKQKYWIVA